MRLWIVSACLLFSSAAYAQWATSTEEDVFSGRDKAVMIGGGGPNESVYFDCDGDRNATFSIIFRYASDKVDGIPVNLVARVDKNERRTFKGTSYEHNNDYYGFIVRDTAAVKALAEELRDARSSVLFGYEVPAVDLKSSFSVQVNGSTSAANKFLATCADTEAPD